MRRKRWPWVVAGSAALVAAVVVSTTLTTPRTSIALDPPDDLDAVIVRIEAAVPVALASATVPGASVAIVQNGRPVWSAGFGVAGGSEPVASDTLFPVGSISKPVAAATILELVHAGTLDLDAPVSDHLGDWRLPGGTDDVTLRRLLSHTAGIDVPGYLGTPADEPLPSTVGSLDGGSSASTGDAVRMTSDAGHYAYSGGGYTIAQLVAETATGRPFAELAEELVLRPRGMTASGYACTTTRPADAAPGHDRDGRVAPQYLYAEAAAAGLCSTADDLALFLASLTEDTPQTRLMETAAEGTDGAYGLGLELGRTPDGRAAVAHPGVNRGYTAYLAAVPGEGFGVAILTNGDGGQAVVDAVLDAIDP
ncbi:serine hydrolase domain-containing protein [Compostimonas suwonensis]|uniref:CubicO group peptidase (Beta-lactamase class C family) n=1 Tax=Compostimonas suwonensis TaxID=1048394 RepID=A0A2M9C0Q3_9MICO|nr:serine hydrolase domain-containing protein [Compostimonas suwonensis]PJJ63885.1 CubicO group peptidase (beta-lactamase class C family) [Compostimonas suwonensis]